MARHPAPEELRKFLEDYQGYALQVLTPNLAAIRNLFDEWMDSAYWGARRPLTKLPSPSPIEHRWSRIKRPESAVDKIIRRPELFREGLSMASVRKMNDAVAGRIAVYFLSNIPLLHREIMNSPQLEFSPANPPLAYLDYELFNRLSLHDCKQATKDSGYASVHYIVRFRESVLPDTERPWWELQVRTLAEHLWAQIHHILGYKGQKKTDFAVTRTFQMMSGHLRLIDEGFNLLYDELTRWQEETTNFGDDDLLNAENLPAVLAEIGTGCAQREIDGLLRVVNSRGVDTVGKLRAVATPKNVETIRNTYLSSEGRAASNFEIVASLAAIAGVQDDTTIVSGIRTQIEFLKAWEQLKTASRSGEKKA